MFLLGRSDIMWDTGSVQNKTVRMQSNTIENNGFEQWYEKFHSIYTYNPQIESRPHNVKLSGNLSPLTNFFLNIFVRIIEKKNLIVSIPDNILRLVPLISYLYAFKKNKSVIVFTQKTGSLIKDMVAVEHNRNYHLLNKGSDRYQGGKYFFEEIPMGYMSEKAVEAKVYLPRARRATKKEYIQLQKENFLKSQGPKILLYHDENNSRVVDTIERITLDTGEFDGLNVKISPGLLLFENADRFVHSQYSSQLFLKWISPLLDRKISFLFHFANTHSKFIHTIKDGTESLVASFGPLLLNNVNLRDATAKYFKNKESCIEWPFLMKYNVDCPDLYQRKRQIKIMKPLLEVGNVDYHFKKAKLFLTRINEEKLINKTLYYKLRRLLFILYDIVVNPSKYKERYGDESTPCRYYTIPALIQIFRSRLSDENKENQIVLDRLLSEIYCMYLELKECKRYKEKRTYSRVAKDFRLLEKVDDMLHEQENETIILATYSALERNILKGELDQLGLQDLEVLTIEQINRSAFPRSHAIIILPGQLRMKYLSELIFPYKKVLFLSYKGINNALIEDQIELLYNIPSEQIDVYLRYLEEIYSFLDLKMDGLFINYNGQKIDKNHEENTKLKVCEEIGEGVEIFDKIKGLVIGEPKYEKYREHEEELIHIENTIDTLEEERVERENRSIICYETSLEKVGSTYMTRKLLPIEKTYLYLKEINGEVEEGTPRNLRPGYFIVILDNDEKKTSLDLILEIFNLEESIDKNLIVFWKEKLAEFVEIHDLSYTDLYNLFQCQRGFRDYLHRSVCQHL